MIVPPPPLLAGVTPPAHSAVGNGARIGLVWVGHRAKERSLHLACVGSKVVEPKCFLAEVAKGHHHVGVVRAYPLNASDEIRIQAELQDGAALSFLSKFRVHDFVRPITEQTWFCHSLQDVGATAPRLVAERGLNDDLGTSTHRGRGSCN